MSRKVLCKLPVKGNNYFLLTTLTNDKEDGFQLVLCDGETVWNGKLSADEMDSQRKKLKMDLNTYYKQTLKALTREDDSLQFEYSIKVNKDDTANMIWKKTSDDIKFQLGHVTLELKDDGVSSICYILNHCVNTNKNNVDKIQTLETDNDRLSQERSMALKRLEKCVAAKEEMEKDLFSKFVAVLNSKKEKIRELKQNGTVAVENEEVSASSPSQVSIASSSKNGRLRHKKTEDKYNSENEENTDEEEETPPPKRQRKAAAVNSSGDADTSLVLEDVDAPSTSTVVKRPGRQRTSIKTATPSKPVLPKVKRNQSNESLDTRKTRMSKSSSNNSNLDAEDLFGDL